MITVRKKKPAGAVSRVRPVLFVCDSDGSRYVKGAFALKCESIAIKMGVCWGQPLKFDKTGTEGSICPIGANHIDFSGAVPCRRALCSWKSRKTRGNSTKTAWNSTKTAENSMKRWGNSTKIGGDSINLYFLSINPRIEP